MVTTLIKGEDTVQNTASSHSMVNYEEPRRLDSSENEKMLSECMIPEPHFGIVV